ncbi:hypothetical protein PaeCFBP13512_22465 [Paenibacillus sp. CFBP13512]|uniref:HNH endonuclease n=1 Tax=Paenibacillus sp. CFBP13512 TaxID=2184007 RepID=UPI0010C03B03|nr:HNH endonuclease [Paenibacillus sp. CFBP13512]TKJ83783.1 hypothetical protein PaeCFBP13512_22465 [Paenibacillus sp. CFBP13512]
MKISTNKRVGTGMFSRMNYQVQRGMKEILTIRDLSMRDWHEIKNFFNNQCAYCGIEDTGDSRNGLVPDHLIPAVDYGDYVIGNVIPACHGCNDRRGKKNWEPWLVANYPTQAEQRVAVVKEYLNKFPYDHHLNPIEKLSPLDQQEYEAILKEWNIILNRAKNLRDKLKEPN